MVRLEPVHIHRVCIVQVVEVVVAEANVQTNVAVSDDMYLMVKFANDRIIQNHSHI